MYESKISANPETISVNMIRGSKEISFSFDTNSYQGTIDGLRQVIEKLDKGNKFDDGEMVSFIVYSGKMLRMVHIYDNEVIFEFHKGINFERIDVPLDDIRQCIIEIFELTIAQI
jgi:hypothetical protein